MGRPLSVPGGSPPPDVRSDSTQVPDWLPDGSGDLAGRGPHAGVRLVRGPEWAHPVCRLLDDALGAGMHDPVEVREMLANLNAGVVVALTGDGSTRRLVGAGTCTVLDEGQEPLEMLSGSGVRWSGTVGLLESVAVTPAWRGFGVGMSLTLTRMAFLRGLGCATVMALSWESGQPQRSRPLLERVGFRCRAQLSGVWEGSACPLCGPSCGCSAALMVWQDA